MAFLSPSRTVLLIADEGLGVYVTTGADVRHVDTFPWNTHEFEDVVSEAIVRSCGKKPVLILYDMVEQHYRKERIPKVASFDRSLIIDRKLRLTFPSFPVRAALALKESGAPGKGAAAAPDSGGKLYLFTAVPGSEVLSRVMEAVQRSMAPVSGFALLPVESSDMVKVLSQKLSRKAGSAAARWVVFVGQQRSGGLRQIVTKNGELALTRMTPVADSEENSEQWASDVLQEFRATMSYVSRFGYTPEDSLDVIVISGASAGESLGQKIDVPCHYTSLTPVEAGRLLGIRLGEEGGRECAESLHVGWAGRKSRFILPMKAPDLDRISWPRRVAVFAMVLLLGSAAWLAFQALSVGQSWLSTRGEVSVRADVLAKLDADYKVEVDRKAAMGFDVELVQGTLQAYDRLQIESLHLLPLVRGVGEALAPSMSINAFDVAKLDPSRIEENQGDEYDPVTGLKVVRPAQYEARFQMKFPPGIKPEEGVKAVNDLVDRLKRYLPGQDISIVRQVANLSYTGAFEDETSSSPEKNPNAKEYEAEILIKGPGK